MLVGRILAAAFVMMAVATLLTLLTTDPAGTQAEPPPQRIRVSGTVRDFLSTHSDFGLLSASELGHCAGRVDTILPPDNRPRLENDGNLVMRSWYDEDANPIAPYEADGGLSGGHLDVDVYDERSSHPRTHQHQFDDMYDVSSVDLVNDPNLLYDRLAGPTYANDLRVEFVNSHHGSGTYTFEADGVLLTGETKDGFSTTFPPLTLTAFRIDFETLLDLKATSPRDSQKDIADRNDAFSIRMYDVESGDLVYELAVYHHAREGEPLRSRRETVCGEPITDSMGVFGDFCHGGITSAPSFGQWYRDVPGTNQSQAVPITLTRNAGGVYEYLTDVFYPVDNQLLGNEGEAHNHLFTYTISAIFTHHACTGQFFEFEGNDDAWVYIDDRLAIDLGGVATPEAQHVTLDRLDLTDGQEYQLDFFYAHRRPTLASVFRMRTNLELFTGNSGTAR